MRSSPRTVATTAIRSAARRRAANASASIEDSSTHCASSMDTSTGADSASWASSVSSATRTASGFAGSALCASALWSASACGVGQVRELADRGPQQLGEAGEGELGLGLDTLRLEQRHAAGLLARVTEQRGLADPGFAPQDEDPAAASARGRQQRIDAVALGCTTHEHESERTPRRRSRGSQNLVIHAVLREGPDP